MSRRPHLRGRGQRAGRAVTITDTANSTTSAISGTVTVAEGDVSDAARPSPSPPIRARPSAARWRRSPTATPANVAADFTATINWGDGTTTAGSSSPAAPAAFTVIGHAHLCGSGQDTVTVTLTDDGAGHGDGHRQQHRECRGALIGAGSASPRPKAMALTATPRWRRFTDANPGDTAADFTATINWGDGDHVDRDGQRRRPARSR